MKTLKYSVDLEKRNQVGIEPSWSTQIDRWYQLDELGFSFCEALHEWNYLEAYPKPDMIFLAIEGASNVADYDFVNSSSQSPAAPPPKITVSSVNVGITAGTSPEKCEG